MPPGRTALSFLLICVGCGGIPLAPPAQMWVATQAQSVELQAIQTKCDLSSQVSSGSLETSLSIWVDQAAFVRCMEGSGWVLEPIGGVSPTSGVTSHVNVRSGPSPRRRHGPGEGRLLRFETS